MRHALPIRYSASQDPLWKGTGNLLPDLMSAFPMQGTPVPLFFFLPKQNADSPKPIRLPSRKALENDLNVETQKFLDVVLTQNNGQKKIPLFKTKPVFLVRTQIQHTSQGWKLNAIFALLDTTGQRLSVPNGLTWSPDNAHLRITHRKAFL